MDQDKTTFLNREPQASTRTGSHFAATDDGNDADATRYVDRSDLPQDPVYPPQQTAYMPRAALPRTEDRQRVYAEAPRPSYPAYEPEPARPRRRGIPKLVKALVIILVLLFVLSLGYSVLTGLFNGGALSSIGQSSDATTQSANVSLDGLQGQYWSNAKTILKTRGANIGDIAVLTDDGTTPIVDSNWTVSSIYYNSAGKIEVQLAHQTAADNAVSGALGGLQGLGDKVAGLGDTVTGMLNNLTGNAVGTGAIGAY